MNLGIPPLNSHTQWEVYVWNQATWKCHEVHEFMDWGGVVVFISFIRFLKVWANKNGQEPPKSFDTKLLNKQKAAIPFSLSLISSSGCAPELGELT